MVGFKQRIGSSSLVARFAFRHEIREFTNMSTRFENGVGGHGWAGQFNDVAKLHPVVDPHLIDS